MRFKIVLSLKDRRNRNVLPISYQYELSSWIYRVISSGNEQYSEWLHNNGFQNDSKQYRLFSFSNLIVPVFQVKGDRLLINSETVCLYISFLPERSTEEFIKGIFHSKEVTIGDKVSQVPFIVKSIELLPLPQLEEEMSYKTISPVCLSRKQESGGTEYFSPTDQQAEEAIRINLINKYTAFYGTPLQIPDNSFLFTVTNTPKSKLITIKAGTPKQSKVRGFECTFKLKAPVELHRLMYATGCGGKGAQGFGCVEIIK